MLQLPVKEVGELLGYNVSIDDNRATLTKDNIKIEYNIGTKSVLVNNKEILTATASNNDNGVIYAEMNLAIKELGLSLNYDKNTGDIIIK
ncbi:stalk domain-containing protein [Inconstantimicrobium porci]|uniref:Copper amine oxidase N-terminal domain-containing protein n=1 Tax=Inconstantimicrobium porci TaxID=2652291 RepID=A0A7X2MVQ2_9CLOT|nr:stalk domain-containing protein [Inconstantimicrobium porci]MSR89905.1 copper amine oxidase N-terminal domain-containing protein [Inconstantimicrobium porci]